MNQPTLVYSPHPLLPAAGRRIEIAPFLEGETISEYLERVGIALRGPAVLALNGRRLPRRMWSRTRPRACTLLTLRAAVAGGGGGSGGKDPMRTVLSVALLVAGNAWGAALAENLLGVPAAGFDLFGINFSQQMIGSAIISIGGNLVLGALLPPPRPNLAQAQLRGVEQASPTYALSGGSNRARPYEPLPLILGTHRVFPDYGAKEFTQFEGEDQVLYACFNFGYGDLVLSDYRIGNTPIANYEGVTLQVAGADGKLSMLPSVVDSVAGGALEPGIAVQRTGSTLTTTLVIEIAGALYRVGNGGYESASVDLTLQYRAAGAADWQPFVEGGTTTIESATTKPLRRAYTLTVPSGQYEVRVTRTTAAFDDAAITAQLVWSQLLSMQPDPGDYTGQNRVGLKIKASGQLNGRVEQFSALAAARCPVWNGSAWVQGATSNPAFWILFLLRGAADASGRILYGAKLADARIDIDTLKAFATWCDTKSLTFDGVIDRSMSLTDALEGIARCGMGSMSMSSGKHGVVWDAPDQAVSAVYGMGNIIADSYRVEYAAQKVTEEIVLNFVNPDLDWQTDRVRAVVPGVTNPQTSATMDLWGCTDKDMAGRIANLMAADQYYHNARMSFQVDHEGMVNVRGDTVMLAHDMTRTRWGYSGRLMAGSTASVLKLDRAVPFTPAATHYALVKKPDGSFGVHQVTYQPGESDSITLASPLSFNPSADADGHPVFDYVWMFDLRATPGRRVKIVEVKPASLYRVALTVVDDDAEYYARESVPYTHVAVTPAGADAPVLTNLQVSEELVRVGTGYVVRVTFTWDATGRYDHASVRLGVNGAAKKDVAEPRGRRYDVEVSDGSVLDIEVTGIHPLGFTGPAARVATMYTVLGAAKDPPSDVPWFTVDGDSASFGTVNDTDLAGYRIRFHYGQRFTASDANPMHDGLLTSSPFAMRTRPSGRVTLLIVAVDTAGRESANPAHIVTDLGDALVENVVETFNMKALGFPGEIVNATVNGSGNLVADDATGAMWAENANAAMWGFDSTAMWNATVYKAMYYTLQFTPRMAGVDSTITLAHTIAADAYAIEYRRNGPQPMWTLDAEDMWAADDTTPMWTLPPGEFPVGMWAADDTTPMWADDAGAPMWQGVEGGYQTWPGSVMASNEPWDVRISTSQGPTQGAISALTFIVDMPDVLERVNDVAIAAGGTRLPIAKSYRQIKNVQITVQDDGNGAVGAWILDKDAALGPLVKTVDDAGTAVAGLIDATVQGY